jgi:hypothetical protein
VEERHRAGQVRLHRGAAGVGEVDLAELLMAGVLLSEGRRSHEDRAENDGGEGCWLKTHG